MTVSASIPSNRAGPGLQPPSHHNDFERTVRLSLLSVLPAICPKMLGPQARQEAAQPILLGASPFQTKQNTVPHPWILHSRSLTLSHPAAGGAYFNLTHSSLEDAVKTRTSPEGFLWPFPHPQPLYLSLSHCNPSGRFATPDSMLLMGRAECQALSPAEMQDVF